MKKALFTLTLLLAPALSAATKLPVVEVPAPAGTSSDTLVVFVSGDGGWAKIDKEISAVLAADGMPVAGLNALQYFWAKKTPELASADLRSLVETYLATWHKTRVVLVGYSRGADVLPAMVARLPQELRERVRLLVLLGPSPHVEFEFHVSDWLRDAGKGAPVKPDIDRLHGMKMLCLYGQDDKDALCPALANTPAIDVLMLKGAHHFDGGYDNLGRLILEHLK